MQNNLPIQIGFGLRAVESMPFGPVMFVVDKVVPIQK